MTDAPGVGDWTAPDTWECVQIAGGIVVMVDKATRREIENWLNNCEVDDTRYRTLEVVDIAGSDFTMIRDKVLCIESNNPEIRARCWALNEKIKAEKKSLGYIDDD